MDRVRRNRFTPSVDGLENRQLLSAPRASTQAAVQTTSTNSNPVTQRTTRIERIQFLLDSIQPGRYIPPAVIADLQSALYGVRSQLGKPNPGALGEFQKQLRLALAHPSLGIGTARGLQASFNAILSSTNAPAPVVANLQSAVEQLIQVNVQFPNPGNVSANDYSAILTTALSVGQPLRAPAAPKLLAADSAGGKNEPVTRKPFPRFGGTYFPAMTMQLLDKSDNVVGFTTTNAQGKYTIQPLNALSPGVYSFRVRGFNNVGDISLKSALFKVKVIS